MLDLLKLGICLLFLLYSCRSDLKTRTVPNELWGVVFVAALPLVIAETLNHGFGYLLQTTISVVGIYTLTYLLFRLGAFGGADAKALIALSFIFPDFILAFSTLVNAITLYLVVPLGMVAYNLCVLSPHEISKNPSYLILGYKCSISDLKGRHVRLIEDFECDGDVATTKYASRGISIDDQVIGRLENLASRELIGGRVWVAPGIPFMIPITAGFVCAVLFWRSDVGIFIV